MPAKITVCYHDRPVKERILCEDNGYRMGRAQECELILEHPTVSRNHARVAHQNKVWSLSDERSRNGTKVNGIAVTHSSLTDDALISVGALDCLFEFKTNTQITAITSHDKWREEQCQRFDSPTIVQNLKQHLTSQLQNIIHITGTQRGILLLGEDIESIHVGVSVGMRVTDFKSSEFEGSVGAISRCLVSERPVIAMDVSKDKLLHLRKSIELKEISALACIPLFHEDKVIGVVYTDSKMSDKLLTELDIEILKAMSQQFEATVQALLLQQSIDALQLSMSEGLIGKLEKNSNHLLTLCH
ncbi:FHA domain-containing protein [Thalassotalea fusca]